MDKNYLMYANMTKELIDNLYNSSYKHNDIAYMSQNTCERYMKHIIDKYYEPTNDSEHLSKIEILRSHNLNSIKNYIHDKMDISYSDETSLLIDSINGFYFTTRYPSDNSMIASESDIDRCYKAVDSCQKETMGIIATLENSVNNEIEDNLILNELINSLSDDEDEL